MYDLGLILTRYSERPVLDKTGIQGLFDIKLQWNPFLGRPRRRGPAITRRGGARWAEPRSRYAADSLHRPGATARSQTRGATKPGRDLRDRSRGKARGELGLLPAEEQGSYGGLFAIGGAAQRRVVPTISRCNLGAAVEQCFGDLHLAAPGRHMQRRAALCSSTCAHIGAALRPTGVSSRCGEPPRAGPCNLTIMVVA
jgi:hypothetical protein